jgi:hypothetical protein
VAGAPSGEREAFAERAIPVLRAAVADLSWLLGHGYTETAAATLVGDHYQLTKLQRLAVRRCAASDASVAARVARRSERPDRIAVDGFNQLVTVERGLAGGAVLRGRDGACRDVAGIHGTWRRTDGTPAALAALTAALGATPARWVLDAPVSNSGRLAGLLRERGFEVEVVAAADARLLALAAEGWTLATSDGGLIGRAAWTGLAERAIAGIPTIDLGDGRA